MLYNNANTWEAKRLKVCHDLFDLCMYNSALSGFVGQTAQRSAPHAGRTEIRMRQRSDACFFSYCSLDPLCETFDYYPRQVRMCRSWTATPIPRPIQVSEHWLERILASKCKTYVTSQYFNMEITFWALERFEIGLVNEIAIVSSTEEWRAWSASILR
jgi:hypothetical protein